MAPPSEINWPFRAPLFARGPRFAARSRAASHRKYRAAEGVPQPAGVSVSCSGEYTNARMPPPIRRREASSVFSGDGCLARLSPAGANVVAAKPERNGGKSRCVPSEFARNMSDDASVAVRREVGEGAEELRDAGASAGDTE